MKFYLHWISEFLHERYCIHYWEQVAQNEWWLNMLMEITKDKE